MSDSSVYDAVATALTRMVEVQRTGDVIRLLTPVERPDGEAVQLTIRETVDGLAVSDSHEALWSVTGAVGTDAFKRDLRKIEHRFGVDLLDDQFVAIVDDIADLGDVCLRVAQASASLAAARHGKEINGRRPRAALKRRVAAELRSADLDVVEDRSIRGASGHAYNVDLFLPKGEEVLALVPSLTFDTAQSIYTKLSDIKRVNGFHTVAILDDPEAEDRVTPERRLLGQVAQVVLSTDVAAWARSIAES